MLKGLLRQLKSGATQKRNIEVTLLGRSISILVVLLMQVDAPSFAQQSYTPKNIELRCRSKTLQNALILYLNFDNKTVVDMSTGDVILNNMVIGDDRIAFYDFGYTENIRFSYLLEIKTYGAYFMLERKDLSFIIGGSTPNEDYPASPKKFKAVVHEGVCFKYVPPATKNMI